MTRDEAIDLIVSLEGGYVNDVHDPGGETKFGISKRSHPSVSIADLTAEQASAIYLAEYWQPYAGRVADIAPRLAVLIFDSAVNQGPKAAVQILQSILSTPTDGVLGPLTLDNLADALEAFGEDDLVARYAAARAVRYATTRNADRFLRGWMNRLMTVVIKAVR